MKKAILFASLVLAAPSVNIALAQDLRPAMYSGFQSECLGYINGEQYQACGYSYFSWAVSAMQTRLSAAEAVFNTPAYGAYCTVPSDPPLEMCMQAAQDLYDEQGNLAFAQSGLDYFTIEA